jgi:pimeloyl-ACP methyl ester carboxylesterase
MPFVENQSAKLYWDEQGSGEPLLLIMGLSYPSYMWHRSRPVLAARYRTVALDNRGVGQSDVPPGIYSMALMASDAASVLDAAGVDTAHVFGVSMGGMIAQEFALQYPNRVRSLILGCTAAGGPQGCQARNSLLKPFGSLPNALSFSNSLRKLRLALRRVPAHSLQFDQSNVAHSKHTVS